MEGIVLPIINKLAAFVQEGGSFMWVIFLVWAVGLGISLERFFALIGMNIDGASFMNELHRYILGNDIQGAINICSSKSKAVLPKVLSSGLKRANQSAEQIQNAIDATSLEVIPKIEKRLNYIQLVANISTLFGLLGTIQGLIESFSAVASADPAQKAELLALGISKAMNTTFLGLLAAITVMILHTYLASKADQIVSTLDEYSVKLMDLIGTRKEVEE